VAGAAKHKKCLTSNQRQRIEDLGYCLEELEKEDRRMHLI
jgi:hypothetical protein